MLIDPISWIALAVILASIVIALQGRFLAVGSLVVANVVVHVMNMVSRDVIVCSGNVECDPAIHTAQDVIGVRSVIQHDLGLHPELVAAGDPLGIMQLLTHMFVHADFFHIFWNVVILLAFALPFEERIRHRPFTLLYLAAGFAGAFSQMATAWGEPILMVGASGAVFGIIGAFAAAYPNQIIAVPVTVGIIIFVRMRVLYGALIFGVVQLVYLAVASPFDNTAYFAHLGGLVAGVVLAYAYVRRVAHGATVVPIDVDMLAPFAVDEDGRRAWQALRDNQDIPEIRDVWLERFLLVARSPNTGAPVMLRKGKLVSTKGEQFDIRPR